MFRYLSLSAFALVLFMAPIDGAVAQTSTSANDTMPGCRHFMVPGDNDEPFLQGWCGGLISALSFMSADVCNPKGATRGQIVRVVVKYIDDRPARMHEDFRQLAVEAMRAAWPCK